MSSDEDSADDRYLFSGGLTMLSRKREENKSMKGQSTQRKTFLSAESDSDCEDEIVVMPPMSSGKPLAGQSGPKLTATGANAHDPVNMADDDDSSDDSASNPFELSLSQRLSRRVNAGKGCTVKVSEDHLKQDSSACNVDVEHLNVPTRFSKSMRKETTTASQETTYTIESKVGRLKMNCQDKSLSSSDSSSDDNTHLAKKIASVGQRSFEHASKYASIYSESDSEDSLLAVSQMSASIPVKARTARAQHPIAKEPSAKANQKELAKEMREKARRDKQLAKEMEKDVRQQQRMAKQLAAQEEKENRKRRRIESDQTRGKRAMDEIAVLMEHTLCNHEELTILTDLQESGFLVDRYPSGLGCDVVQFVRCDFVNGGGARAVEMLKQSKQEEYQHLPIVGVVFHNPIDFISKIERDVLDEDDDYPKLESFLKGLEVGWRAAWKLGPERRPRFIFYLNSVNAALDKLWVKSRRKDQTMRPPPTGEELQDALIWLSIHFCVDCIHYLCPEDLSTQLTKMAVWLAREPYQRQMTDLECAKKTKMHCSDMDPPLVRSQDCWRRQLCQVPGISESMASSVVGYFPTMRSLYLRYQDASLTEDQKVLLLTDCFGREGRKYVKCSDAVYRILTSRNPNELI